MPLIEIPNGIYPGRTVTILGHVFCGGDDLQINLQRGAEGQPYCTIGFHMNFRMHEDRVATNSFQHGQWEEEISHPCIPIKRCGKFKIEVKCEGWGYVVFVNGDEFCTFPIRIPYEDISYLCISGDVVLDGLSWT